LLITRYKFIPREEQTSTFVARLAGSNWPALREKRPG
jgi:hypothetical protein